MDIPTLHEIAAMRLPASVYAMRKHYDPKWGFDASEEKTARKFHVKMEWTISGTFDQEIEAETEKEAKEKAEEWVFDDAYSGRLDCQYWSVKEMSE